MIKLQVIGNLGKDCVVHKATTRKKQPGLTAPTGPTEQLSHLILPKENRFM